MTLHVPSLLLSGLTLTLSGLTIAADEEKRSHHHPKPRPCERNDWTEINGDAPWAARSGLQAVALGHSFYLMGGRTATDPATLPFPTPGASKIWGDVWKSSDRGRTWEEIVPDGTPGIWPSRAFFQAVKLGGRMYVLGGQDFNLIPNPNPFPQPGEPPFFSESNFYNDVWCSEDGINWIQQTDDAGWAGRAGLSAVAHRGAIYVMGGSFNDDPAIIGGPPTRVYFNDVWCSRDKGRTWTQVTDNAPWAPRAGAVAVSKNGRLYLIGGEDGFTCESGGDRCPPYFNDVWCSRDGGRTWVEVTGDADWSPRPGHQVAVVRNHFVLFGGFGLSEDPTDPFKPANPLDVWISKTGRTWKQVNDAPWDATAPADGRYDFDVLVAPGDKGCGPAIYSFGGSNETFNFLDPTNHLNLENDVWRYTPPFPPVYRPPSRPQPFRPSWLPLLPWWWGPGLQP